MVCSLWLNDRNGKHARALWHKLKGQEYSRIEKETYSKLPLLEWKESQDSLNGARRQEASNQLGGLSQRADDLASHQRDFANRRHDRASPKNDVDCHRRKSRANSLLWMAIALQHFDGLIRQINT